jgi:hypothetical protein
MGQNPSGASRVAGEYRNNHRAAGDLIRTRLMTIDIDGNANVERLAFFFGRYRVAIHTTYKSTEDNPRVRVVLMLKAWCTDAALYSRGYKKLYAWLTSAGIMVEWGPSMGWAGMFST